MNGNNPSSGNSFDNIVDDVDARKQAREWAYDSLRGGQSPEWVENALRGNGWSADDAAEIAEEARKKTRHLRGVVTREDVAVATEHAYRTRQSSPIMDGYVDGGGATGFGQPAMPVDPSATDQSGNILGYRAPPDRRAIKRVRDARIRGILKASLGGLVLLPGIALIFCGVLGLGLVVAVIGGLMVAMGISEARAPTRLVGKLDRGLIDRFHRNDGD
jgi:hypothetical protein